LPPLGARQTNPLLGVKPKPGPLGQDFYFAWYMVVI